MLRGGQNEIHKDDRGFTRSFHVPGRMRGSTGIAASGAGMTAFMVPGTIEDYAFKRDVLAIFKEKLQIRMVLCTHFQASA